MKLTSTYLKRFSHWILLRGLDALQLCLLLTLLSACKLDDNQIRGTMSGGSKSLLSVKTSSFTEGQSGQITFELDKALNHPVEVNWSLQSSSSADSTDLVLQSGTATIPANQTSVVISVEIYYDAEYDDGETINVVINGLQGLQQTDITEALPIKDHHGDRLGNIIQATPGYNNNNCVIQSGGKIYCWGTSTSNGQIGNGTTGTSYVKPTPIIGVDNENFVDMGGGWGHYCALTNNGEVYCWGENGSGQLGDGNLGTDSNIPVKVLGLNNVNTLAVGHFHNCVLLNDNSIKCWGRNTSGELGDSNPGVDSDIIVGGPSFGQTVTDLQAGSGYVCALLLDKTIECWGENSRGLLGNGNIPTDSLDPVPVSGLSNVEEIALSNQHACARLSDNSVVCWGNNDYGQIGNGLEEGPSNHYDTPQSVIGISNATQIYTAISDSTCVKLATNEFKCWGKNNHLGLGESGTPKTFTGPSASGTFYLGNTTFDIIGGYLRSWGSALGTPYDANILETATIVSPQPTQAHKITLGSASCYTGADNKAYCWGDNTYGQLGDGNAGTDALTPQIVPGLTTVDKVFTGASYGTSCALLQDDTVQCWGSNWDGKLGRGTAGAPGEFFDTPAAVTGLTNVKDLNIGFLNVCAILNDNTAECWGNNDSGQVGDNTSGTDRGSPQTVIGLTDVKTIRSGYRYTCALLNTNTIKCWGDNTDGKLGIGNIFPTPVLSPTDVVGLTNVAEFDIENKHACALTADGKIYCWGDNTYGQLGVSGADRNAPAEVVGLPTATAIDVGSDYSCALLTSGEVHCWGRNQSKQLGRGMEVVANPEVPEKVLGITNATQLTVGGSTSCIRELSGVQKCWGSNTDAVLISDPANWVCESTP